MAQDQNEEVRHDRRTSLPFYPLGRVPSWRFRPLGGQNSVEQVCSISINSEHTVMRQHDPPEVIVGAGKAQVSLRGREAIRAAGWTIRLVLVAKAMRILVVLPVGGACYLALKWYLS